MREIKYTCKDSEKARELVSKLLDAKSAKRDGFEVVYFPGSMYDINQLLFWVEEIAENDTVTAEREP